MFRVFMVIIGLLPFFIGAFSQKASPEIYYDGWIDFNKNGVMDVFEDPTQTIEDRVSNLLSLMTLDEKTVQMATLYGFGRVLKDELPTPQWKHRSEERRVGKECRSWWGPYH